MRCFRGSAAVQWTKFRSCISPLGRSPCQHRSKSPHSELCGQQHNSEYDPFQIMAR